MEIKKLWVNNKEWTLALSKKTDSIFTIELNGSKQNARLVDYNHQSKLLYFEINKTIYKTKVLQQPTSTSPQYSLYFFHSKETFSAQLKSEACINEHKEQTTESFQATLLSPLSGKVIAIHATTNQFVTKNQPLVTIESMKMENILYAKTDVFIKTIPILQGDLVQPKQVLMTFENQGEAYATAKKSDVNEQVPNR